MYFCKRNLFYLNYLKRPKTSSNFYCYLTIFLKMGIFPKSLWPSQNTFQKYEISVVKICNFNWNSLT